MKTLFALLGLFALAGCEDTPATGGYTASRASYPTDQPIYTGVQDYRPESYPDSQYPFNTPAQNQLSGLQPLQPMPYPTPQSSGGGPGND
jgi:hypothetical protein